MNILSLFDGMSCARIALERVGITVNKYFASEIDKYSVKVAMANYPDTIQVGCVKDIDVWDLPQIDLLIGGSPCQGFSFAGKQLNFEDPRSKLFFEYEKILKKVKPRYFLLENVKMKKEYQDVISGYLGLPPIEINSALVTAQNRKRLYWTNIPGIEQPKDRSIMLKDVVLENTEKMEYALFLELIKSYIIPLDKSFRILDIESKKRKIGFFNTDSESSPLYNIHGKAVTLCGEGSGDGAKMGQYLFGCITPDRVNKRQNGQRFNKGDKFYTLTGQDRHGVLVNGYIRKILPIECERLQSVPEGYTKSISDAQRYKMLGNGFTVDVVAHILKGM